MPTISMLSMMHAWILVGTWILGFGGRARLAHGRLGNPDPVFRDVPNPFLQRVIMGLGMGLTAMGIMYSPWGKQSGTHINPAVTLTF
jgi:glycerol uptake facilitator-like aquaporin